MCVPAVHPRTRVMLLVLLILLLCALTVHLVGMPDHHAAGMALGACLAVLISLDVLRAPSTVRTRLAVGRPARGIPIRSFECRRSFSRPPPWNGTVLRM